MTAVVGVAIALAALAAFYYSLPRNGQVARFVGTEWEGYAVVAMICAFATGLLLTVTGAVDMLRGVS